MYMLIQEMISLVFYVYVNTGLVFMYMLIQGMISPMFMYMHFPVLAYTQIPWTDHKTETCLSACCKEGKIN